MKMTEGQIFLSALAQQEAGQEIAQMRFHKLLDDLDVVVTNERFGDGGIGSLENFQLSCHLQAPTIYDVAVRLAKAGWSYTDSTENRVSPSLLGPKGEVIQITREKSYAVLLYMPADAQEWSRCVTDTATITRDKPGVLARPPVGFTTCDKAGS